MEKSVYLEGDGWVYVSPGFIFPDGFFDVPNDMIGTLNRKEFIIELGLRDDDGTMFWIDEHSLSFMVGSTDVALAATGCDRFNPVRLRRRTPIDPVFDQTKTLPYQMYNDYEGIFPNQHKTNK